MMLYYVIGNFSLKMLDRAKSFQIAQATWTSKVDGVCGVKLHGHGHDALKGLYNYSEMAENQLSP